MKKFILKLLLLFGVLVSTTSCFEIIEEITLHNNGSGSVELTFNVSQSKTKMASIMLLDSVNGHKVPSKADIKKHIVELTKELKATPGISNVKHTEDFEIFIVTIACDFNKIENLNDFAQKLWEKQKVKGAIKTYGFNVAQHIFSKNFEFNSKMKKEFSKLDEEDQKVFKNASYTSIYRFDSPVKKYSNPASKLSKTKKALMMKLQAMDIIAGKQKLTNTIELSK